MVDWRPPLPSLVPLPPKTRQAQRHAYEADVFLTQLRRVGPLPASTFGPPLRMVDMPVRAFVLVRIGRRRHYGICTGAGRLRVVHWNRRPLPPPVIPGAPAVETPPLVMCATHSPGASTRCRIIAVDYRTVEPSTYDPPVHSRAHPPETLPHELELTALRSDASGWYRLNVRWHPGVAAFESPYFRRTPDGVEYRRLMTGPDFQAAEHGRADSMEEYRDGIVEVFEGTLVPIDDGTRAMALRDERPSFT